MHRDRRSRRGRLASSAAEKTPIQGLRHAIIGGRGRSGSHSAMVDPQHGKDVHLQPPPCKVRCAPGLFLSTPANHSAMPATRVEGGTRCPSPPCGAKQLRLSSWWHRCCRLRSRPDASSLLSHPSVAMIQATCTPLTACARELPHHLNILQKQHPRGVRCHQTISQQPPAEPVIAPSAPDLSHPPVPCDALVLLPSSGAGFEGLGHPLLVIPMSWRWERSPRLLRGMSFLEVGEVRHLSNLPPR